MNSFLPALKGSLKNTGDVGEMVAALSLMLTYDEKPFDILLPKPLSRQMTRHTARIHKA